MISYEITKEQEAFCLKHANLMARGAITKSFKHDKIQSEDVYFIGKIGELTVLKFLKTLENDNFLKINHKPFRDNYERFNWNDDFIVNDTQLEVRTKARSVNPLSHYECCTDCIKPFLTYIFVSYNKLNKVSTIVGYATEKLLREKSTVATKGDSNSNFVHKVNEYNIQIKNLFDINNFKDVIINR